MHPDMLGALARHHERELRQRAEPRHPNDPWRQALDAREPLRRARARIGAMLVDLGVHLMVVT